MWLIVLQIILALPRIFELVKLILDLINGLPKEMRHDAEHELCGIILNHKRDEGQMRDKLNDFRDRLNGIKSGLGQKA